jgi:hypothetical protein
MAESRRQGRFCGYRTNCENVPCLSARVVAAYLADPRRIPYLLIWIYRGSPRDWLFNSSDWGQPREAVRLAPFSFREGDAPSPGWVEVKHWDGHRTGLRVIERPLPHHGGKAVFLLCRFCQQPRRALFGWNAIKHLRQVTYGPWQCRTCAQLNYASEGGALVFRSRWVAVRQWSGMRFRPRPEVWEPLVFTSPLQAFELGFVQNVHSCQRLSQSSVEK